MRVIGGEFRSRRLQAVPGSATRPTSDRLRETLFNVLGARVAGARFADLYAGTGAVGIEALSRGAAYVLFVERAAAALATLRSNLRALGIEREISVEERAAAAVLERRARQGAGTPLDIVFLDPPYDAENEYSRVLAALGGAGAGRLLAPEGVVVAEHASRQQLPERVGGLVRVRVLRQGDASLSFYEAEAVSEGSPRPDAPPSPDRA